MRKIYLAVFVALVASALLFIASFFYLDKEKHKNYYFSVTVDGKDAGSVKVDKFVTDDNIFYRSRTSSPFEPLLTDSRARLTLDRGYGLLNYLKVDSGGGAEETVYLENKEHALSFVGTSMSEFACLMGLPVKQNTFVFEEYSPLTYLPILENYDFSIGRAQAFNVVTTYSPLLPPMKRLLTLTSIRDDYMKINSRKVKVECLLVRMRNLSQGMLFVTKTGRSLVCIEFPDKKLKITRTFNPGSLNAKPLILKSDLYTENEVRFNDKKTALAGTFTAPKPEGKHPAALLVGGIEESDRDEQGLFSHVARMLGDNGFAALRFDRRGIGASGGDPRSVTDTESFADARAARDYLSTRKDVDPERMIVIGHGKGALYAARIAAENKNIKAMVLMAPSINLAGQTDLNFDNLNEMAAKYKWDEQYLRFTIKSRFETMDRVKNAKSNWIPVLKKRCFVKKLKEELEQNPTDIIRKVECPVLILHGKEDEAIAVKDVASIDKALEESGNKNHNLIY